MVRHYYWLVRHYCYCCWWTTFCFGVVLGSSKALPEASCSVVVLDEYIPFIFWMNIPLWYLPNFAPEKSFCRNASFELWRLLFSLEEVLLGPHWHSQRKISDRVRMESHIARRGKGCDSMWKPFSWGFKYCHVPWQGMASSATCSHQAFYGIWSLFCRRCRCVPWFAMHFFLVSQSVFEGICLPASSPLSLAIISRH